MTLERQVEALKIIAEGQDEKMRLLTAAFEDLAMRFAAQEAIMVPVARKLGVTKQEAFAALDLIELTDNRRFLPAIKKAILRVLHHHK